MMLAISSLADFQFLYPYWLILIPIVLLIFLIWRFVLHRQTTATQQWDDLIDPQLQPYVINNYNQPPNKHRQQWLWLFAALLVIVALAGPSLHKEKRPAYQIQQGLVIALDLSMSMLAEDMRPNRMQRAKFKLMDLLHQRREGQTGLLVFAANAFSVSPLTTELATLAAQVEHLTPYTMPAQGSRLDYAIEQAVQLLQQAELPTGHILLLTDGVADQRKAEKAAQKAYGAHYTVSIIGFGTEKGSIIPLQNGEVVKNQQGQQVISRLDPLSLQKIAEIGGGLYSEARVDNKDLAQLLSFYNKNMPLLKQNQQDSDKEQLVYHAVNHGIWLLLPLIPLFLLLFRRGYLLSICVVMFTLAMLQPQAVYAFTWADLWFNDNQQGQQLLTQGDLVAAEKRFTDKQWQAVAAYRQGDYQRAQQLLAKPNTASAWYNKGTMLAQAGQLKEAESALQTALQLQPDHHDAQYNLVIVQQHLLAQSVAALTSESEKQSSQNKQQQANSKNEQQQQQEEEPSPSSQSEKTPQPIEQTPDTTQTNTPQQQQAQQREQQDFKQQWLRRIPDDPSGLWRRKFKHQYQQRQQADEDEPW